MDVLSRVDQLRSDAHAISGALHASLHDVSHAELTGDLAQIAFRPGLVLHYRRAADHFQIRNPSEICQNFVLHAVGEKGIGRFLAQILKRKHGDRFFVYLRQRSVSQIRGLGAL